MDTKVIVEVTCPYCNSKLMLKKKKEVSSKILQCPNTNCGKELHVQFDVTANPQTSCVETENKQGSKKKTVYNKETEGADSDVRKETKDKTVYKKDKNITPHNIYNDFDDDDDVPIRRRRKARLRERIFLTHITWFGLRNNRFQLSEGTTIIGRYDEDEPSDISIKGDDTMSRRSVAIIIEEEDGIFDYKLKVLNATNKVKVNDQRVKEGSEVYLEFGDIIMLGNSKFKFDNR